LIAKWEVEFKNLHSNKDLSSAIKIKTNCEGETYYQIEYDWKLFFHGPELRAELWLKTSDGPKK
jgi:hypothetical protein